jgi:hypothetical protein
MMSHPASKWTNLLSRALEDGTMTYEAVADMCLAYMSEADVEDMVRANDLASYLDPTDDEEED